MIGVYKISNKINGKSYIGRSINIHKRFIAHKNRAFNSNSNNYNLPLYKDMRKYGIENFTFDILEECEESELDEREKHYIRQYKANGPDGYNQSDGGNDSGHFMKLSKNKVNEIIDCLKTSTINSDEIGKRFGVSGRTIRSINSGECCKVDSESYPIRPSLYLLERSGENTLLTGLYNTKSKDYFCELCGNRVCEKGNLCVKCAQLARRKSERPNAIELARLIYENGFSATGRLFGVSGNVIKKWCDGYQIPRHKIPLVDWYKESVGTKDERPSIIKKEKVKQKKAVRQIDPVTGNAIKIFESENEAARSLGKSKGSHIGEACRGIHELVYGFKWEYV